MRPKDGYNKIEWDGAARLIWGSDLEVDNTILLAPDRPGAGLERLWSPRSAGGTAVQASPPGPLSIAER